MSICSSIVLDKAVLAALDIKWWLVPRPFFNPLPDLAFPLAHTLASQRIFLHRLHRNLLVALFFSGNCCSSPASSNWRSCKSDNENNDHNAQHNSSQDWTCYICMFFT